jgi:hypothetical protein
MLAVWPLSASRLEGAIHKGLYEVQWQAWRRPAPVRPNSVGMSSQYPAWRCSDGDGRTGLTATGKTAPAGLTSRCSPV